MALSKKKKDKIVDYYLTWCIKEPNYATGNWWDNAEDIKQAIKQFKKRRKKK